MKVKGIDATYYTVKDLGKSTKFYTDLLGADPTMHMENFVSEWTFDDGATFGLYQTDEGSPSAMFAVPDVAAAVSAAKSHGAKIHGHGGDEVTDTPVCHMAFGEDPEGNQFILHKRK
jgi:predicted enzyme related to lactoylglutathione lyase